MAPWRTVVAITVLSYGYSGTLLAAEAAVLSDKQISRYRFNALRDLPAGDAKNLTAAACTHCHELGGLKAYKGYWSRQQWYDMVDSMVKNGSLLDKAQINLVTDYLFDNYGRKP